MANFKDISGQKFGKLTVVKRIENDKHGNAVWECMCDCGNKINVLGNSLRIGKTRSCGCIHAQIMRELNHKQNKYDLTGNYGIGWTNNTNQKFYFDLEDYDEIKEYGWIENDQGYIIASNINGNAPRIIRMHRLVTKFKYQIVDHINQKRYDNRKNNLRSATKQTNGINRDYNTNNSLKIKGIYFNAKRNKYEAKIHKGKKVYFKSSDNISELILWRRSKEKELYGEYAFQGGVLNE